MSLNGLDASVVVEAHQSISNDQGGWFLLKYVNRDTVDLLSRGSGGVNEARAAVERYEEKSPLYGLVQYRRKKVILKYVPEGTSRLLQVRLAVQFQTVLDTFVPHDTVFSFTTPADLSETALGRCTMSLQGPASQTSSSSSLRRGRLNDITEDAEDVPHVNDATQTEAREPRLSTTKENSEIRELPQSAMKASMLLAQFGGRSDPMETANPESKSKDVQSPAQSNDPAFATLKDSVAPQVNGASPSPATGTSMDKALPATPQASRPPTAGDLAVDRPTTSLSDFPKARQTADVDNGTSFSVEQDSLDYLHSQHLSAAESSSISRWTEDVLASTYPLPKAKKKLGPRPHVETPTRPRTSGASEESTATKRVANLPTSVRVQTRPPTAGSQARPGSQQSSRSVPGRFVPSTSLPPPMPSPIMRPQLPQTQFKGPGSVASSVITETAGPTPEKLRLMKALQMRKRNQVSSSRTQTSSQNAGTTNSSDRPITMTSTTTSLPQPHLETKRKENPKALNASEGIPSVESNAATPTSAITASEESSTKPSSISDSYKDRKSSLSISSATNSSNTPKAETMQQIPVLPEIEATSMNFSQAIAKIRDRPSTPVLTAVDEAFQRLTGSGSPSGPRMKVVAASPKHAVAREEQSHRESKLAPPTKPSSEAVHEKGTKKRSVFRGSIKIPPSGEVSDISDDESFIDELQHATVQEAKPVSVARTPITPIIARRSTDKMRDLTRSVTSPISVKTNDSQSTPDEKRSGSRAGSTRSVSTALPQWPPPGSEQVPPLPKQKVALGSSISKRIKALEGLSNRDSVTLPSKETPQRASTFTNIVKKSAFMSPSQVDIAARPNSSASRSTTLLSNSDESGETKHISRLWGLGQGSKTENPAAQRSESVSLAARLMGARHNPSEHNLNGSESLPSSRRIALTTNRDTHDNGSHNRDHRREISATSIDSEARSPTSSRRRFSLSSHKSGSTARLPPSESMASRLSFAGSFRKLPKSAETASINEDKKASRASRMLKRLSGIGSKRNSTVKDMSTSPSKDASMHETIMEGSELDMRDSSIDLSTLQVVEIGDVNVQFPETLLWKRRSLRIDDQGFLIFAPPSNDLNLRGRSRKFHLAEFKSPSLPDREREEMAWSILLDLREGGCIQCACENKQSQQTVLKMLVDAHSAYQQLYG